jgi:protease-4
MSLDADGIVDRRRIRRKLVFWRVAAILLVLVAVIGGAFYAARGRVFGTGGNYIARIQIDGLIRNDSKRVAALTRLGNASRVKAVVVHVDSPGGTTAGSEQLYDSLTSLKAKKPVVVVIDGLGASGAYITAMAADHIVARGTSLVGSIGVLFQFPNFTGLLKTVGVQVEEIKSAPLKAAPNGFEPTSPEARAAIQSVVMDSFAWFKDLVSSRRHMDAEALAKVDDGRVFTGRQAIGLKLIDELGDEKTAIAWLAKDKGINAKLPVRDFKLAPRFGDLPFIHATAAVVLNAVGLPTLARALSSWGSDRQLEATNLDGLLALWHPSVGQ